MCKKINDMWKTNQSWIMLILFIAVIVLAGFVITAKSYDMTLKVGDKELSITKPNLEIAFSEFGKNISEIVLIESSKRLEEQITYLDDITVSITRLLLDHHVKLLAKHGIVDNCYSNAEYKSYAHITKICLDSMKSVAIQDFKKMNLMFTKDTPDKFRDFVNNCITKYISEYGEVVKREWIDLGISKEENYEWTRSIVPGVAEKIAQIMNTAFDIQIKYAKQIEDLKCKTVIITSNFK